MSELQILFKTNEIVGKSITLNQALEVMGRVVFTAETLEEEGHEFNMDQLIKEVIDEVAFHLERSYI